MGAKGIPRERVRLRGSRSTLRAARPPGGQRRGEEAERSRPRLPHPWISQKTFAGLRWRETGNASARWLGNPDAPRPNHCDRGNSRKRPHASSISEPTLSFKRILFSWNFSLPLFDIEVLNNRCETFHICTEKKKCCKIKLNNASGYHCNRAA